LMRFISASEILDSNAPITGGTHRAHVRIFHRTVAERAGQSEDSVFGRAHVRIFHRTVAEGEGHDPLRFQMCRLVGRRLNALFNA
jgi:hypothetical protein